jgi:hypothetical protein
MRIVVCCGGIAKVSMQVAAAWLVAQSRHGGPGSTAGQLHERPNRGHHIRPFGAG